LIAMPVFFTTMITSFAAIYQYKFASNILEIRFGYKPPFR